ncbi:MAG: hypothetical protein JNG85_13170 [Spirochaetaceae bacterium]|nr:hypothetical protein [Spirochaetaceae bacterium]
MNYATVALKAAASIKAKGKLVLLRVTVMTGGDPAAGIPGAETVTDYQARALEEEMTFAERSSLARILGSDVCMDDRRLMVAAVQDNGQALPRPSRAEKIVMAGKVYSIVNVGALEPGETAIYYEVQIRG